MQPAYVISPRLYWLCSVIPDTERLLAQTTEYSTACSCMVHQWKPQHASNTTDLPLLPKKVKQANIPLKNY